MYATRCQLERAFRDTCIIALTETWLDESISDTEVSLDNFTVIRSDRTGQSGKTCGGGVCLFINHKWANNIKVHRKLCTPHLEMLTLSIRPYYLPREFSTVVVSCVYVAPSANTKIAAELIAEEANAMLAKYPGAPLVILGDFNTCTLDTVLPSFQQYVNVPTRGENILDKCYGNITNAFRCRSYPPLGLADHNIISLLPLYKQELKHHKPQCYSALQWSEDAITQLQGSLACTEWDIFDRDLSDRVSIITDYINFCISTTIPIKTIKKYPNSKPWITSHIKQCLKEKHQAFKSKDWVSLKMANRNIRNEIFKAKLKYKNKLESEFASMDTKRAFQRVKTLTGCETKSNKCTITDPESFSKELNTFYTRLMSRTTPPNVRIC